MINEKGGGCVLGFTEWSESGTFGNSGRVDEEGGVFDWEYELLYVE